MELLSLEHGKLARRPPVVAARPPNAADFATLRAAFSGSGGLARGDELAQLLQDRCRGDFLSLARLIAARRIFSFPWHHSLWVPMFQFDPLDLSIRDTPQQVAAHLAGGLDGWALALWFALPNRCLAGWRPVDLLHSNLPAVLRAAADREAAP